MCTVSWIRQPEGYRLWFNRDEQHGRAAALPPRVHTPAQGLHWLGATDPVGGGTWLGVNAAGVSLGLLNYYERQTTAVAPGARSRGLLISDLLPQVAAISELDALLAPLDLSLYRAFYLLAWSTEGVRWWVWDEQALREVPTAEVRPPIATSSIQPQEVAAARRAVFAALPQPWTPEAVRAAHLTPDPERPAFGVCMERDDARTVSLSEIFVKPMEVFYGYKTKERSPGGWSALVETSLERVPHSLS
ncbi:MAG: NRDE family protein [Verrucomicrobiota bacterium JB022]|nr:NRDE family protein [Verrucomicrobiota bacterium JB022]